MSLITVETREQWQSVFDGIAAQFADIDYTETLRAALPKLEQAHAQFFANQAGPTGAWPPNAASTIRRKGHSTILRGHPKNNQRLQKSLASTTGDSYRDVFREGANNQHAAVFGTSVPYSIFNQEGTTRAPARPHVGLTEPVIDTTANDVADATVGGLIDKS